MREVFTGKEGNPRELGEVKDGHKHGGYTTEEVAVGV